MQIFKKSLCAAVMLILIAELCTGCKTVTSLNNNEATDEYRAYESYSIILFTAEPSDLSSISASDLTLSQALGPILEDILKSKKIRTEIDQKFPDSDYTLSLKAIDNTEMFYVTTMGEKPENLTEICDVAAVLLCEYVIKIIPQCSCSIVDPANTPIPVFKQIDPQ